MSIRRWALVGSVLGPMALAGCHGSGAKTPSAAMAPAPVLPEIHVDGQCGVRQGAAGAYAVDAAVCRLVGVKTSQHVESGHPEDKGTLQVVTVREQVYRLQNTTAGPVTFVVEQPVEKGWTAVADSGTVAGATAVYRVTAAAGEVVRLHVGARHAVPMADATGVDFGNQLLK
jgi:hypothetical protein